ncbi:MAG: phosphatidylserine/phosphatidylglycerophosphate/cardiolipin synthase family protein [Candidatus Riflebacteria bacterium]|nr:phosphatidylserine/phosphatidylglycerophosphate/cardiolipin synthase family protein [Candidatus Riflebacteria bacterium]
MQTNMRDYYSNACLIVLVVFCTCVQPGLFGQPEVQELSQKVDESFCEYQSAIHDPKCSQEEIKTLEKKYLLLKAAFVKESSKSINFSFVSQLPMNELISRTISKVFSDSQVVESDMDIVFPETDDNYLMLLQGENFWDRVIKQMKNAKSSVHVQMFGMEADKTGWEIAELLCKKAKSGIEVRIVADRMGARMAGFRNVFSNTEEEKLFKFYSDNGVQVVFFDQISRGTTFSKKLDFYHFDHRKSFIIDGEIAFTGGYTLQRPSREEKHDLMIRAQGSVVNQMQASFLLSFRYNGGKMPSLSPEEIKRRYFPLKPSSAKMQAKLELNVPRGNHSLSDSYIREIDCARNYLYIINPYITDDDMVKHICAAAKRGVNTVLVLPGQAENKLNDANTRYHFEEFLLSGVKIYLYQGKKNLGKLHAKGLIRDDSFASFGSCNMDTMALRHNYEQNITSTNNLFVRQVKNELFERDFKVSQLFVPPEGFLEKAKIRLKGKATQILDRWD